MRVFIGITLSEELKDALNEIAQGFRPFTEKGNFSHVRNYHITLKYYGEVSHTELEFIEDIMDEIALTQPPFELRFGEPKTFRKKDKYLLYASVIDSNNQLKRLAKMVEYISREAGFDKEDRNYTPHVTLAREVVMSPVRSNFNTLKPVTISQSVTAITLFQSHRVQGELMYTPLYEVSFKKPH